jgi:radial spoke head protein 1
VYEGDFVDGQRHGKGKFTWQSGGGGYYEGEFANNQLIYGKGMVTSFNGDVYTGEFKAGLKHGKGKMIYADGKIEEGNWERGEFKGNN